MHFTPQTASWLNMVERFFLDITVNRLRCGVFTSVPELGAAIDKDVAHHKLATRAATTGWSRSAAPTLLAPAGLPSPVTASEKNSRLIAMNCVRGPGTSASSKIASGGHTDTQMPQLMHSSGWM